MKSDISTIIIVLVGCASLLVGLLCPPIGIVDNSLLVVFGEILVFVAGLKGICIDFDLKRLHFYVGTQTPKPDSPNDTDTPKKQPQT